MAPRQPRASTAALAVALVLSASLAAACAAGSAVGSASAAPTGSPVASTGPETPGPSDTPAVDTPSAPLDPRTEIDAVTTALDQVLQLYRNGSSQKAIDRLAETYEDHFELVELPLEAVNASLKDDLEGILATKLRQAMIANAAVADVEAMIQDAKAKLVTARGLLG
jgi:hypothetical protein